MSEINWTMELFRKPSTDITKEEYYTWLKDSKIVDPRHFTQTAFNGYHEGSTIIAKNGMYYDMIDWFDYTKNGIEEGYRMRELYKVPNQDGDGI